MASSYLIFEYRAEHSDDVLSAIGEDPDWQQFTVSDASRNNYRIRLSASATVVCYSGSEFCGFLRAILDEGVAVYISELFVVPRHRNQRIAQRLIESIKAKHASLPLYALSDEDRFYQNKGYRKIGSVFQI